MDSIIESRRIEDQEGFKVEYEYSGLKFAHYVGDRRADASSTDDIVLFLPGLDGSGCTLGPQVPDLVQKFDVWCLSVPPNDRSTFATVNRAVITHIETLHRETGRRVLIVGESFGGMLALSVVLSLGADLAQKLIKGLLLVNPATGFERTLWQVIIPLFRNLPEPLYAVAVTPILVAVGPDVTQFRRVLQRVLRGAGLPWEQAAALKDTLEELVSLVKFLTDTIPMDTLQWRITRWLQTGVNRVNPRLKDVSVPVVVAAGTQDRVLPSVEEAARLKREIPDCTTIRLQGSGHISLDGRVNLTNIITRSPKLLGPSRKTPVDPVKGWMPPSQAVVDRYTGIVDRWLERFTSPVFYSTDANGNVIEGLSGVPTPTKENPVLLVGNHQLYGVDLGILVKTFIDDRGLFVRGLAHPALFQDTGREGLDDEIIFTEDEALFSAGFGVAAGMEAREMGSLRNVFQQFGAVPVSARNFYALLQKGEAVLLFPGGARETYHRKGEDYRLFWPDRSEFVRMASAFNATVVPFSAVGCADSFRFLLDSEELLRLPVVGRRVREMSDRIPNARGTGVPEDFIAPILFPLPPARFYFVFGKPYSTGHVRKDKDAATKLYEDVKSEVSSGIDAILQARSNDVYRDFAPRFAYETATGRKAPAIPPHTLQRALDSARTANGLE